MGLDPGVVGDRPVPHLLAALLTTLTCRRTGKGELSHRRWSDTCFLVASLTLCFFLYPFAFPLLTLFSSERFFPLLSLLTFFSSERTSHSFLYPRAVSAGCRPPQAHPTPRAHGYHDDPCAPKKDGRRSSRKIAAEEEWGRASELVKEMCVNVSVVKKKASHKRGDRSFTLLNASHLRSH